MIDWKEQEKINEIRNRFVYDLKLCNISWTDFERYTVIENNNGEEEIVQVKEVSYEALPNTKTGVVDKIIETFTMELGWEHVNTYKQAWVNGYIKYIINFKY